MGLFIIVLLELFASGASYLLTEIKEYQEGFIHKEYEGQGLGQNMKCIKILEQIIHHPYKFMDVKRPEGG